MGKLPSPRPLAFFLMGPTATGKTQLAVEVAERFPIDIISVDAGQVYREMDIGTAKPDQEILKRVPHRLIDICDPWHRYSAGLFRRDALVEIENTVKRERIPFLVGGTSFYFRALEMGLSDLPPRSEEICQELVAVAEEKGWPYLHEQLMVIDSESVKQVSPNDAQRILRLYELYRLTGQRPSEIREFNPAEPVPFTIVKLAVARLDREAQNEMISQRFTAMMESGFLNEAERLYKSEKFDPTLPSMRSVGYRQAWQYFGGQINLEQMKEDIVRETCSIAKRQLTWIRNQPGVIWIIVDEESILDDVLILVESCLKSTDLSSSIN